MAAERFNDLADYLIYLGHLNEPGETGRPVEYLSYQSPDFFPVETAVATFAAGTPQATVDEVNAIIAGWNWALHRTRPIAAIYQDLTALGAAVQDGIIADLQLTQVSGKWSTLRPPQDAPAAALRWAAVSLAGASAAEKRQAAGWIVAMWCQQHPMYLVNPPQAPAVNIPGNEPV